MKKYFKQFPKVVAAMSGKEDGSMKLFDKDWRLDKKTEKNRKKYFKKIGIKSENVVYAYLKNGTNVKLIKDAHLQIIKNDDGLITKQNNLYLAITAADCIPVYFYDAKQNIIGLAHAGWRGIAGGIIGNILEKIIEAGGNTENIHVFLGPGINDCHFEINKDIMEKFSEYPEFVLRREEKIFVDLKGIIKKQLLTLNVKEKNIDSDSDCTYCSENLFSFRRDKTEPLEAMIAIIGMV